MTDTCTNPRRPSWWNVMIIVGAGVLLACMAEAARAQGRPLVEAVVELGVAHGVCPSHDTAWVEARERLKRAGLEEVVPIADRAFERARQTAESGQLPWVRVQGGLLQVVDPEVCRAETDRAHRRLEAAYQAVLDSGH